MEALEASNPTADGEREHLARAHHEICTALTVLRSNVELVRIRLRDAPLPENGVPVHEHLKELEAAVDRLRDMAREMKGWHDGIVPR
jgi:signal transduction histidine kinase